MLKESDQVQLDSSPESELDQLKGLKSSAESHITFSKIYLRMLQNLLEPYDSSEKNMNPWKSLKEGTYYLNNAYKLVQKYKNCITGPVTDKNIQSVMEMLVALEFDQKHLSEGYTDEAYGGTAKCFVSKGQGTKYYKLLHSESTKDLRLFIEIVELNIDVPVKRFLESIEKRLSALSEKL